MTAPIITSRTSYIDGDPAKPIVENFALINSDNFHYSFREINSIANDLFDNHPALSLNLKETMACIRHSEGSEPENAARLERYLALALEVLK